MTKIDIPQRHNSIISFTNENGDSIVARLHTFRGITYLSMFVNDSLVVASEPAIKQTTFATKTTRRKYGAFLWKFPFGEDEYPNPQNYNSMCELWYIQPSEVDDVQ